MEIQKKWQRQKQECEGNYYFCGSFYATNGVAESLPEKEIMEIILDVKKAVKEKVGLDYLQVFKNEEGQKIFVIDQLNKEEIESGDFSPEDNYAMVLFAEEY